MSISRFVKQQDYLHNIVSCIEAQTDEKSPAVYMCFACTCDEAIGKPTSFSALLWKQFCLPVSNIWEFIKSKVKKRPPIYTVIFAKHVQFEGVLHINLHYGTAVLVGKQEVNKFYFKQCDYYSKLYEELSPSLPCRIVRNHNFLKTTTSTYNATAFNIGSKKLLSQLAERIKEYQKHLLQNVRPYLSPSYKIQQIANSYNLSSSHELVSIYQKLASRLQDCIIDNNLACCHGDLWSANVLRADDNSLILIDFDKSIYFYNSYDFVYLYLMHVSIKELGFSLNKICSHSGDIVNSCRDFYNKMEISDLFDFEEPTILSCITLFLILRFAERDMRSIKICDKFLRKNIETNIAQLNNVLVSLEKHKNKYSERQSIIKNHGKSTLSHKNT